MKAMIASVFLILSCLSVKGQELQKNELYIGGKGILVHSQRFGLGENKGYGFFVEYGRIVFPKIQVTWRSQLGFDFIPVCEDSFKCSSWWYPRAIRINSYLDKTIFENDNHGLWIGLGGSMFYGTKLFSQTIVAIDGQIVSVTNTSQPDTAYGIGSMFTYQNKKMNDKLKFRYGLDMFYKTQLHSLSIVYRLK